MTTLKSKHNHHGHHNNYDLHGDVEKIKEALMEATQDFKGRAGEIFTDSLENVKGRTTNVKNNVANYTADKPFKSLGIALLMGVALGYFIRK